MTMTPDLKYFLENAQRFTRTENGYIGYNDTVRTPKAQFTVTLDELLDYNPELCLLLTTLEVEARKSLFPEWPGLALRATLAHWEAPAPKHPIKNDWRVTFISRVELHEDTQELGLAATLYKESLHVAGFEYVTTLTAERTRVPFDWAEHYWPGVVGRTRTAHALGYDERKTAQLAFNDAVPVVPNADMDGISF